MHRQLRLATATAVAVAVVLLGVPLGVLVFRLAWPNPWPALSLVLLVGAAAVGAGMAVGSWQAKRLALPLVYLAATAEQLGSSQPQVKPAMSGVEEIDLVTEELARSADRLSTRLAVERRFAADVSHQLRTPLTALSLRLEEIELVSDQADVRQEAKDALEQIDRLVATIDELLARTRRQGAGVHSGLVPLRSALGQQAREWRPMFTAAGRSLELSVEGEPVAVASIGALTQVVATLLENSLKHGAGTTWVRGKSSSGGVAIEVEDQGPGVSQELASRIFQRDVTGSDGTGLGLAVARDLVAADAGRLELTQRQPPVFTVFLDGAPSRD